jgi:hypothetical protein
MMTLIKLNGTGSAFPKNSITVVYHKIKNFPGTHKTLVYTNGSGESRAIRGGLKI